MTKTRPLDTSVLQYCQVHSLGGQQTSVAAFSAGTSAAHQSVLRGHLSAAAAASGGVEGSTAVAAAAAVRPDESTTGILQSAGSSSGISVQAAASQQQQQLLSPEGQALLDATDEFDYLTHIVIRLFENKMVS